jgi:hypothetical protein
LRGDLGVLDDSVRLSLSLSLKRDVLSLQMHYLNAIARQAGSWAEAQLTHLVLTVCDTSSHHLKQTKQYSCMALLSKAHISKNIPQYIVGSEVKGDRRHRFKAGRFKITQRPGGPPELYTTTCGHSSEYPSTNGIGIPSQATSSSYGLHLHACA